MPFTIPNAADAFNANQAEPDSVDFDVLTFGSRKTGVVSGCAVVAQGTPDMTVAVAVGNVSIAGILVQVTAGNGTITTADGSNPRLDLVSINTSGAIVVTAGTAAAEPVFPTHPTDDAVIAAVYIPTSDTTIANNQITDKRMFVGCSPMGSVLYRSGASFAPIFTISRGTTVASDHIANKWYGWAFTVAADVSCDALSLEVRIAGAANVRIGIYQGDSTDFLPSTLIADSGALDCSSTGVKTGNVTAFTLKAGVLYWLGYVTDQAVATWSPRCDSGGAPLFQVGGWGKATNMQAERLMSSNKTLTYGALADPMTSPGSWAKVSGIVPYILLDVV